MEIRVSATSAMNAASDLWEFQHRCDRLAGQETGLRLARMMSPSTVDEMVSSIVRHRSLVTIRTTFIPHSFSERIKYAVVGRIRPSGANVEKRQTGKSLTLFGTLSTSYAALSTVSSC